MVRKTLYAAMVAIVLSTLATGITYAVMTDPFPDVPEDYKYGTAVEHLHSVGVFTGDSETGTFRPGDNLNRAEFAAVLSRINAEEPSLDEYNNCFPDVGEEWFAPFVCKAQENGLMKGYGAGELEGHFGPGEPLLNAELVEVMSRLTGWTTVEGGEWYDPSWNYASEHNLLDDAVLSDKALRGLLAEIVFRTAVVDFWGSDEYSNEDAVIYLSSYGSVAPIEGPIEEDMAELNVSSEPVEDMIIDHDAVMVEVLKFSGKVMDDDYTEVSRLTIHPSPGVDSRNVARLYVRDEQTGEIIFAGDTKLKWSEGDFDIVFPTPIYFRNAEIREYTIMADFDWETNSSFQLQILESEDFETDMLVIGEFPLNGATFFKDPSVVDAWAPELCANWDDEYYLPYPSGNESIDYTKNPGTPGGTVVPGADAHAILPIDQGSEGICAAAAIYSSLRWLEELLDIEIVADGQTGLDGLIAAGYGDEIDTADKQDDSLEEYLEGLNECIDVEVDTQAGLNVSCSQLLEYKNKNCDIPLAFRCEATDADGNVLTGDAAESWGHRVDLTDVDINPDDDDKCTVTFANSWKDSTNPGTDLDGLGAGRFEQAEYDDDDESFDITAPWAANYKCKLRAAMFICVDEDEC